jgi:hypothetical protein
MAVLVLYVYIHLVLRAYGFISKLSLSGVSALENPARFLILLLPCIAVVMVAALSFGGLAMWIFPRGDESVRQEGRTLFRCSLYYVIPLAALAFLLFAPRLKFGS